MKAVIELIFKIKQAPTVRRESPRWLFYDHTIYPVCSECGSSSTVCAERCPNCNAEMSNPEL